MNLLTYPVFRVQTPQGTDGVSLPGLLALMGEDQVESLPGLQRHQEDAFHIFCCLLAGAVLVRQGKTDPRQDAAFWLNGIRALTQQEGCEDDSAWMLVVGDPTKPAFMQSPVDDEDAFERIYKPKASTPDALDILRTAKNHDVKSARGKASSAEDWAYALISLQTMTGGLGNGNCGIARMNSACGSRICVGWRESWRMGRRYSCETARLLELRSRLTDDPPFFKPDGSVLLWVKQWDGDSPLPIESLDPFFIEVARRVRLGFEDGVLLAFGATSKSMRIAASKSRGVLGDPWTPVVLDKDGKEMKSLTVLAPGFTTRMLCDLIFGAPKYKIAPMQVAPTGSAEIADTGDGGWFTASVFIGGRGISDGFHCVSIYAPKRVKPTLLNQGTSKHNRLSMLSKRGLDLAEEIRRPLHLALMSLMEGGPEKINTKNSHVDRWAAEAIKPFAQQWNLRYFDWLWTTVDAVDDTEALQPWFNELSQLAGETLDRAIERSPQRRGRSYRAKTKAKGLFFGTLGKKFSQFMEVTTHGKP